MFQNVLNKSVMNRNGLMAAPAVTVETVTPELAAEWLERHEYQNQRKVNKDYVSLYAKEMAAGRFQQNTLVKFAVYQGRLYLVDGQHRLHAIIKSCVPVQFIVSKETANSWGEVAKLYTSTDNGRRRNYADAFAAFELDKELGMTRDIQMRTAAAVSQIISGFSRSGKVSPFDMINDMHVWSDYGIEYGEMIKKSNVVQLISRLRTSPVYAVGVITMRYQPEFSVAFWRGVVDDSGLKSNDPRKVLRDWLLVTKMRESGLSSKDYARTVQYAWSAFFEQRSLSRLTTRTDKDYPLQVVGTPYDTSKPNNGI